MISDSKKTQRRSNLISYFKANGSLFTYEREYTAGTRFIPYYGRFIERKMGANLVAALNPGCCIVRTKQCTRARIQHQGFKAER